MIQAYYSIYRMAVFFWILIGLTWIGGVISMLTENFNLSVSSVKQIRITLPAIMVSCLKKLVPKNQGTNSFFLSKLKTQNGAVPKQNGEALISTRESNREFLENMSTASVKGLKYIYFFLFRNFIHYTLNPFSDGQDEISLINRAPAQENAFSENQFCENLQGTFERPPQFNLSAKVIQKQRESLKNIKYADEQEDMEIRVRWRPEIINFRFPRIQGSDFASKASTQLEV